MFDKFMKIALKKFHSDLKISPDFIVDIRDEKSSWSFISKLAQIIEGLFTKILVQRLNEETTYNTISNLPQSVRLNLAFDLNLITNKQKFLFLTVAEIRNDYIHNISNVEVTLADYLKNLKSNRRKEIYKRFEPFILDEKMSSHKDFNLDEKIKDFNADCLNAIFTACCLEILRIHGEIEGYSAERNHAQFRAKQAEQLLPKKADASMFLIDEVMVRAYIKEAREVLKKSGLFKLHFPSDK